MYNSKVGALRPQCRQIKTLAAGAAEGVPNPFERRKMAGSPSSINARASSSCVSAISDTNPFEIADQPRPTGFQPSDFRVFSLTSMIRSPLASLRSAKRSRACSRHCAKVMPVSLTNRRCTVAGTLCVYPQSRTTSDLAIRATYSKRLEPSFVPPMVSLSPT